MSAREPGRLWRTEKGDLVPDGHPEAVVLAYGETDELSDDDKNRVRGNKSHTSKAEDEATPKKAASPTAKKSTKS